MVASYITSHTMAILSTLERDISLLLQAGAPIHVNRPPGLTVKLIYHNMITRLLVKDAVGPVVDTFTPRIHSTTCLCYLSIGRVFKIDISAFVMTVMHSGKWIISINQLERLLISTFVFAGIQTNIYDLAL